MTWESQTYVPHPKHQEHFPEESDHSSPSYTRSDNSYDPADIYDKDIPEENPDNRPAPKHL
jgi:hypothetical protein